MKRLHFLLALLLLSTIATSVFTQRKFRLAPPYLADEIFRLSQDCYYFKEYLLVRQNAKEYVVASFLNREAIGNAASSAPLAKPVSPCGKRLQQIRLYRRIGEKKVVVKDSAFLDVHSISLGAATDFDQSGTKKLTVNHICNPPQGMFPPLLCYAISVFEITKKEKLRHVLTLGNVPERYVNGEPQHVPLEPVVMDNLDKTPFPECLAIDDFWEGDLAFRSDDFPKMTLIYTWDMAAKVYKHHSDQFPWRLSPPARVDSIPDSLHLVVFIQNAMALAAIGKKPEALTYIENGLTEQRVAGWKARDPQHANHIDLNRLRKKLLTCIARYETKP